MVRTRRKAGKPLPFLLNAFVRPLKHKREKKSMGMKWASLGMLTFSVAF